MAERALWLCSETLPVVDGSKEYMIANLSINEERNRKVEGRILKYRLYGSSLPWVFVVTTMKRAFVESRNLSGRTILHRNRRRLLHAPGKSSSCVKQSSTAVYSGSLTYRQSRTTGHRVYCTAGIKHKRTNPSTFRARPEM